MLSLKILLILSNGRYIVALITGYASLASVLFYTKGIAKGAVPTLMIEKCTESVHHLA